jgi:enterochelin esterase family protein
MVEQTFRTANRAREPRDGRPVDGGAQTFGTAIEHLDKFAYIGGFSGNSGVGRGGFDPKTANGGAYADAAVFQQEGEAAVSLDWLRGRTRNEELQRATHQAGIKNVYYESPGTAHEWLTWRRSFREFAMRLFAEMGAPASKPQLPVTRWGA